MKKITQLLPDTTGYAAIYDNSADADLSPIFVPLVGWAVFDDGEIAAMVPTDDGGLVPARDYSGVDGELKFDSLICGHNCDEDCAEE
jgi:hypothetical protein